MHVIVGQTVPKHEKVLSYSLPCCLSFDSKHRNRKLIIPTFLGHARLFIETDLKLNETFKIIAAVTHNSHHVKSDLLLLFYHMLNFAEVVCFSVFAKISFIKYNKKRKQCKKQGRNSLRADVSYFLIYTQARSKNRLTCWLFIA